MMLPNDRRVGRLIAKAVEVLNASAVILDRSPLTSKQVADLYQSPQVFTFLREFPETDKEGMLASAAISRLACRKLARDFMRVFMFMTIAKRNDDERDYAIMLATHKTTHRKGLAPGHMIKLVVERQIEREE